MTSHVTIMIKNHIWEYNQILMSSIKTLYNRLQTLITENKSGIVALCRGHKTADSLEYIVYFHSLGYVKVVKDYISCYFLASMEKELQSELKYFSDRDDYISLSELDIEEEHFLDTVINSILWDMAQEIGTVDPDDIINDKWQIPGRIKNWNAYREFTLGLADTIEGDIEAFRICLKNKSRIPSHGKEFQVGLLYDDYISTLVLSEWVWENFKDEETGKEYPIECTHRLLECYHNWRVLYAKFRLAYYHQLHEINIAE